MLEDVPDLLALEPAEGAAPPDPGHLEVVGGGLEVVGQHDLLPLLTQEAEVEVPLSRPPDRLLPARIDLVGSGDLDIDPSIAQEPDGPGVQVDDLDPVLLGSAEVGEVLPD